jgi:hypothetical protein
MPAPSVRTRASALLKAHPPAGAALRGRALVEQLVTIVQIAADAYATAAQYSMLAGMPRAELSRRGIAEGALRQQIFRTVTMHADVR